MENNFEKEVLTRLGSIDITLAKQEEHLAEHIRRTQLLEEDMVPVKEHVQQVNGAIKFIGLLSIVATIVGTVLALILKL
jgi:RecB family endonuclease NucS